jgi:hypothetical protein
MNSFNPTQVFGTSAQRSKATSNLVSDKQYPLDFSTPPYYSAERVDDRFFGNPAERSQTKVEAEEATKENKIGDYLEMAYDVLRGGVNLYKTIKGERPVSFREDLVPRQKPALSGPASPATSETEAVPNEISQALESAKAAFTPNKTTPPAASTPVEIEVEPFKIGDDVGYDTPETSETISPETIRRFISQGHKLDPEELKRMGYGVYMDGSGNVVDIAD